MTGRSNRKKFRQAEGDMRGIAKYLDRQLPDGLCFALCIFTPGEGAYAGYVSNGRRAEMIKALRECADVLEAKAESPPGSPLERQ